MKEEISTAAIILRMSMSISTGIPSSYVFRFCKNKLVSLTLLHPRLFPFSARFCPVHKYYLLRYRLDAASNPNVPKTLTG